MALTARGPSADPTFGFRSSSWHFADCKGYITAQEERREPDDSLQGDLIRECRAMAGGHTPPCHLYSHITGTWLGAQLDHVDAAAGRSAVGCPTTVGFFVPPHVFVLKIHRILWRIQKWLKSTKRLCSHLAHFWATSDSAPRSEAEGLPETAGVK